MTDYTTPPPPPPAGPPAGAAGGGKDNSQLLGIIGAIVGFLCCWPAGIGLGIWSLLQAKKFNGNPMWGYIAIGASILGVLVNIFLVLPRLQGN